MHFKGPQSLKVDHTLSPKASAVNQRLRCGRKIKVSAFSKIEMSFLCLILEDVYGNKTIDCGAWSCFFAIKGEASPYTRTHQQAGSNNEKTSPKPQISR